MLPITRMISGYNHSSNNNITYIVIHDVGETSSARNNAIYFNGGNRGASAHYFVDNTSIYQVVEDYHGAWHVGDGHGKYGISNYNSIGIEMCLTNGNTTDTTIQNTLELTRYLMAKYSIPVTRVVRHYDASRKCCPMTFSNNNWARWYDFKRRLGDTSVPSNIQSTNTSSNTSSNPIVKGRNFVGSRCKELQEKLIACGYNCGGYGADGSFGQGTYNSLIQFQKEHGLVADGLAGEKTFAKLDFVLSQKNKNTSNGNSWVKRLQEECNNQGFSNQSVDGIPGTNTLNGCPTLREGARGNITKLLQEKLVSLGYNTNGVDGIFGGGTTKAVINFQRNKGLSSDGIVGKNTWRKLLGL